MAVITISAVFAQQIVDSAKAVVGRDINYIDRNGSIIASTNPRRIGEFHEVGYQVVRSKEAVEVTTDDTYKGTHKGINYPIFMDEDVIGVIGITGEPEKVSQYGFLLTKICEIFIKEYLLELHSLNERQRTGKLVLSLIYHDRDSLDEFAANGDINLQQQYAAVQLLLQTRGKAGRRNSDEKELTQEMARQGIQLYTYIYPNELVILINDGQYGKIRARLTELEKQYGGRLHIGVGTLEATDDVHLSYHFAKIATRHSRENNRFATLAEDMNLELLLESVEEKVKKQYYRKTLGTLTEKDINLLKVYFRRDMSLKQTAEELFIHKNTLQYQLNQIHNKTGLDPRVFRNAVILYVALRTECYV